MANSSAVEDTIHKELKKYAFKDPNFDVSTYTIFKNESLNHIVRVYLIGKLSCSFQNGCSCKSVILTYIL